jgi:hypothetical protein
MAGISLQSGASRTKFLRQHTVTLWDTNTQSMKLPAPQKIVICRNL